MQVILAKNAGFCMGVRRALNMVLEVIYKNKDNNKRVFTYGPLIHNNQVVELLNSRGVQVLKDPADLKKYKDIPCIVIIRSHGISPQKRKELIESKATIYDATCPRVTKVQNIIKKYFDQDYSIIILGDKGHAEVVGLLGFAENQGYVISTPFEASNLPPLKKVCVVGQTTLDEKLFLEITEILKNKYAEIEIFDTLCDSTSLRQKELGDLCNISDAIIIVGGKNSANTSRMTKLVQERGTPAFHVETADEIKEQSFQSFNNISITAGASTPNWVFLDVVEKVSEIQKNKESLLKRFAMSLNQNILRTNIYLSLGAISLTYASCKLQNIRPRFLYLLLSFLYIFSMHILNQFTEHATIGFNYPGKKFFYERNRQALILSGILTGIGSLILAIDLGLLVFSLVFIATLMGIIYQVKIIPDSLLSIFKYQKIKDIPASKDIVLAIAWVIIIVISPLLGSRREFNKSTFMAIMFVFTLVFIRSVYYGIREVQGDRIVGKDTIPILLGEKNSNYLIKGLSILLFIMLFIFSIKGYILKIGFYLLIVPIYILFYIYSYKKIVSAKNLFEYIIDFSFILSGIIVFLSQYL